MIQAITFNQTLHEDSVFLVKKSTITYSTAMNKKTKPTIAAFDFDGTISYRDTLISFLLFTNGYVKSTYYFIISLPYVIGFLIGMIPRQKAKEKIITTFFKGIPIEKLHQQGNIFATTRLKELLRPDALKRIKWHIDQGHECILISASLDIYLRPWAEQMGFQHTLTSSLKVDANDNITGRLNGLNCWGPEKTRRLEEICGQRDQYILYAYGDSRGDKELLNTTDHPFYRTMGP